MPESVKDECIRNIALKVLNGMCLPDDLYQKLDTLIRIPMEKYYITNKTGSDVVVYGKEDVELKKRFMIAKATKGCTKQTIAAYMLSLSTFGRYIKKPLISIKADDIRYFFALKMQEHVSSITLNNYRRNLGSFYSWMVDNEIVHKNPFRSIERIKGLQKVKKPFAQEDLEKMRLEIDKIKNKWIRLERRAIFETLLCSGLRVSEICSLNRNSINFITCEGTVVGKGQKERRFWINAVSKLYLEQYLQIRTDNNNALFLSYQVRFKKETEPKKYRNIRLKKDIVPQRAFPQFIEIFIRSLGKKARVEGRAYPHRFRRTFACQLSEKGVPIEQIKSFMGHESIDTTNIYLTTNISDLRHLYEKYV